MLRQASGYEAFSEVDFSFTFLVCLERVWSIVAGGPLKLVLSLSNGSKSNILTMLSFLQTEQTLGWCTFLSGTGFLFCFLTRTFSDALTFSKLPRLAVLEELK
jgi:hypothetical protein